MHFLFFKRVHSHFQCDSHHFQSNIFLPIFRRFFFNFSDRFFWRICASGELPSLNPRFPTGPPLPFSIENIQKIGKNRFSDADLQKPISYSSSTPQKRTIKKYPFFDVLLIKRTLFWCTFNQTLPKTVYNLPFKSNCRILAAEVNCTFTPNLTKPGKIVIFTSQKGQTSVLRHFSRHYGNITRRHYFTAYIIHYFYSSKN